ncbi:hypothetical protein OAR27_02885 [Alphaproteobacteria bacterium]|nr:hypothetical protein [Alphaproteobacteria bacterium]
MNGQITKDELKYAFDLLAEKFQHDSADQKLLGLAAMLRLTSRYLKQEIMDIDTTAILLTLEELTNISQNGSPKFILPIENKTGRPQITGENFRLASIAAAVEILRAEGMKVRDATSYVAEKSGLNPTRIMQIRKEFREGKRQPAATKFMWEQVNVARKSNRHAEEIADDLITMSLIKGG